MLCIISLNIHHKVVWILLLFHECAHRVIILLWFLSRWRLLYNLFRLEAFKSFFNFLPYFMLNCSHRGSNISFTLTCTIFLIFFFLILFFFILFFRLIFLILWYNGSLRNFIVSETLSRVLRIIIFDYFTILQRFYFRAYRFNRLTIRFDEPNFQMVNLEVVCTR